MPRWPDKNMTTTDERDQPISPKSVAMDEFVPLDTPWARLQPPGPAWLSLSLVQ